MVGAAAAIWWYVSGFASKESAQKSSLLAAKEYCLQQKLGEGYCSGLNLLHIDGPEEYGPTDSKKEYFGNWFATFTSDVDVAKRVFVVSDLGGKVVYINTTGEREYPYK